MLIQKKRPIGDLTNGSPKAGNMSATQTETSALVVDDDDDIRYAIANILKKCDCVVAEAISVEDALVELCKHQYDIVFCDMRFHGSIGGEALLEFANENLPDTDVVLVSCAMDAQRKKELLSQGAAMCLQKPFFKDTCLDVLTELKEQHRNAA